MRWLDGITDSMDMGLGAGRDWGQEEKGTTEDEMAGWHHLLNGHEFERTPGVGDGCLENPRDGGAWWAAIYGVAQSGTPGTVPAGHCGGLSGCGAAAVGPWAREWRLPALECGLGGCGVSWLWSVGSGLKLSQLATW